METNKSPTSHKKGTISPRVSGLIPLKLPDLARRTYEFLWKTDDWVLKSKLWKVARSHGYSEEEVKEAFKILEDLGSTRGYEFVNFARDWNREQGAKYRVYPATDEEIKNRREAFVWFDSLPS